MSRDICEVEEIGMFLDAFLANFETFFLYTYPTPPPPPCLTWEEEGGGRGRGG